MLILPDAVRRVVTSVPFRLAVAASIVVWHVATTISFAHERWDGHPFNSAPDQVPTFPNPARDNYPVNGKRLIVSRWDAEHYLGLSMRGYSQCPNRKLVPDDMRGPVCDVAFFPGYPFLGYLVRRVTGIPADYALWSVSLVAAFALLFLWTDPVIVHALGLAGAYASLFCFSLFPPACYLVLMMAEACTALGMMGAFVALARKEYLWAALAAGFAGAMRLSGVAAEAGCVLALAFSAWVDPPQSKWAWVRRAALAAVAVWGSLAVCGYHAWRFGDPLLYVHGHRASFQHEGGLELLLHPRTESLIHGMDNIVHDLVWAGALLLLFLLGHRLALRKFLLPAQLYAYALIAITYAVSAAGSMDLFYMLGMSRYVFVAGPAFLALGALFASRPVALGAWLLATSWHLREVDRCVYLGDIGAETLRRCNLTQWIDR
ncbi:MAG: hypothetical protein ABTD50_09950 [Polyangiaceae bacterium]|jgi:hypothetical protein